MSDRIRGVAEISVVHRDAGGREISREIEKRPVTYRMGKDGNPTDIREE